MTVTESQMENTSASVLDNKENIADNDSLLYRPFQSENECGIKVKKECYSTSLDERGYIPVYEYNVNNAPIMWDRETGYVHFTGIWKAMGNSKSDIVKLVDSNPELGTKKIRGGFLRIQGTWIPYDYAKLLCSRTAWNIRKELVPIFGQRFPVEALHPDHEDYGCLLLDPKSNKINQNQRRNYTMRQKKPYSKQGTTKKTRTPKPMKSVVNNEKKKTPKTKVMSVTRLLNEKEDYMDFLDSDSDDLSSLSSFGSTIAPSPTFRVIQTYPPEDWSNPCPLLPPIYNTSQQNTPHLSSLSRSPTPPLHYSFLPTLPPQPQPLAPPVSPNHVSQDIIDTISATILLQRLSQDDGERPFNPLKSKIPSKVIVGHQEFTICWDY